MVSYSLFDALSIGIGGMIGGGIFLLNGVGALKLKKYTPLAWITAMIIALLIAFSYSVLENEWPKNSGTISYPYEFTSNKRITNYISTITILGYIILVSVYSTTLASYLCNYLSIPSFQKPIAFITILLTQIINYLPEYVFSSILNTFVVFKVLVLLVLIGIGFYLKKDESILGKSIDRIKINNYQPDLIPISNISILVFGITIFLSYEGFEIISNAAKDIKNSDINTPLAFFLSILITGVIYAGLSFVTNKHIGYKLADSNKYSSLLLLSDKYGLGKFGKLLIVVLSFVANFSAINATIFTNQEQLKTFAKHFHFKKHIQNILETRIKLPLFKETRSLTLWLTSLLSALFIFIPIDVLTNLGSFFFLLIFLIVCILGIILVYNLNKAKKNTKLFRVEIPYPVAQTIQSISATICIIALIILIKDIFSKYF